MSILHLEGAYENELAATGEFNPQAPKTALMLPSGQRIVLPTEVLLEALRGSGVPAGEAVRESVPGDSSERAGVTVAAMEQGAGEAVIPLVAEQLAVGKRE